MRLNTFLRTFGAGVAVYVIAAACGSTRNAFTSNDSGPSSSGSSSSTGGSIIDVISDAFDDLGNPIPPADAAPLPPDVKTSKCDVVRKVNGIDTYVAEATFPGKSAAELTLVHATLSISTVEGFSEQQIYAHIKDGVVVWPCGPMSNPKPSYTATFVLPQ